MAIAFLVRVMTISFALPIDSLKSFWKSENGVSVEKILLSKILNY